MTYLAKPFTLLLHKDLAISIAAWFLRQAIKEGSSALAGIPIPLLSYLISLSSIVGLASKPPVPTWTFAVAVPLILLLILLWLLLFMLKILPSLF